MHVAVFDSHSFNECKKLGLIALFLFHSNILKRKYNTAILTVVFNSVNKFCCSFTFKVKSVGCYFSRRNFISSFSISRIDTNDADNGNVMCVYEIGGKTDGGPVFLSTLGKQVKNYCLVWAVAFQKP